MEHLDKYMIPLKTENGLNWFDGKEFAIEGKGWEDTEDFFHRLPSKAKGTVRDEVWQLSKSSSGISIHFSTNSPSLAVRWDGFHAMNHMPATGVSGLDLYVKHGTKWKWLSVARPTSTENESTFFTDIDSEMREYILYLPLYNKINHVDLGIKESFTIKPTTKRNKKPIAFYGTSITQGGCASRPGMSYTAILGRMLDNPTINLGFSGNGIQEPEVIDLLTELDPSLFVLDNLPNMNADAVKDKSEAAIIKIRKAHPITPIIIIDNILYCDAYLNKTRWERYTTANLAQVEIVMKLKKAGVKNLIYVKDENLIGDDGEATVDGVHLTDLGYLRFSEKLLPYLKQALNIN